MENPYCSCKLTRVRLVLKDNHPWLSCIFIDPDDTFTRPQRTTVLFCVIFGTLMLDGESRPTAAIPMESPYCSCKRRPGCRAGRTRRQWT